MKNEMKIILTLLAAVLLAQSTLPAAENKPALWAVNYAWYQTSNTTHTKSSMWTVDDTDKPRSKAQPLIGYYDSDNPEVVRWHVLLQPGESKRAEIQLTPETFRCWHPSKKRGWSNRVNLKSASGRRLLTFACATR